MEIIKLHKKCNKKTRKISQPKALSKSDEPKKALSDEPKKVSGPTDDPSEGEQKPKKAPKTPESVDTDSDDELERQLKKASKTLDNEQGPTSKQSQKASKASDDEQEPAVKCIVMYSTKDEQEPQKYQKSQAMKILKKYLQQKYQILLLLTTPTSSRLA